MKVLVFLTLVVVATSSYAQDDSLSLDDLFSMEVESASGLSESYLTAPASMNVITAQDIKDRGYISIDELLLDVPGFDVSVTNGITYMNAYQRGYRTPFTQRTLILINGKQDNHLWTHMANLSRQYPISNIEKVEILYGPSSAVYGANAFLGVINIITKDASKSEEDFSSFESNISTGSFNTRNVDLYSGGKSGDISYSIGAKIFRSDEQDLSDKFEFISNDIYSNDRRWGVLLDQSFHGDSLGHYNDKTENFGVNGEIGFKDFTFGFNNWSRSERYGPYYAGDRAQNSTPWTFTSNQFYLDHDKQVNDKFRIETSILYRRNRVFGEWAEAAAMWDSIIGVVDADTITLADRGLNNEDFADYSYVSYSHWNSVNSSFKFTQNYHYQVNDNFMLSAGIKNEHKNLTRAYDISGYWGAYNSSFEGNQPGIYGYGHAIQHSTDANYNMFTQVSTNVMPSDNIIKTEDIGGFIQGIYDVKRLRIQAGLRYDNNSLWGDSFNPRVSTTYSLPNEVGAIKLIYGEAFQEPAPIQLFGGWSGRNANPNLLPEKARNLELITMLKHSFLIHQLSLYRGQYENVIKEEAENAGEREIIGLEYRLSGELDNPLSDRKMNVYVFYTLTKSTSSILYNFDTGSYEDGDANVGDIAPHKVQFGLNTPIKERLNLNVRGHFVSERELYLRNPLRNQGENLDAFVHLDANLNYTMKNMRIGLKVRNLLNGQYWHPGGEGASAGNDFVNGSAGFHNSIIPQMDRNFLLNIGFYF